MSAILKKKGGFQRNKIILILSDEIDQSTFDVIEWLIKYKQEFIVFNENQHSYVELLSASINKSKNSLTLKSSHQTFFLKDIKSFWYRRGFLDIKKTIPPSTEISHYLNQEREGLEQFLHYSLNKKARLNHLNNVDVNKLIQLSLAVKCGLNIPETIVTTDFSDIKAFCENGPIITKSIQGVLTIKRGAKHYGLFTTKVVNTDLFKIPKKFYPTKLQLEIKKRYELRIFFFKKRFFAMAIFSQNNKKTKVDFRNYDDKRPNRFVPYKLPELIRKKLARLMSLLNLLSGSIDMVVNKEGDYFFLEVNPVGQFGMVSMPCNYFLEKQIARELIRK